MTVIDEIAAERRRQIEAEGWTPQHDDLEHGDFEQGLVMAAISYAVPEWFSDALHKHDIQTWPWDSPPKFKDRRRDLIRAAALLVAEIERLDRAAVRAA